MQDRRQSARYKVIYGGVAEVSGNGGSRECVVRNISKDGAHLEFLEVAPVCVSARGFAGRLVRVEGVVGQWIPCSKRENGSLTPQSTKEVMLIGRAHNGPFSPDRLDSPAYEKPSRFPQAPRDRRPRAGA